MPVFPKKKRGPKRERKPISREAARVGSRVEHLRNEKGWTAVVLARKVDISQPMLSKIENGLVDPSNPKAQATLRKIGKELNDSLGLAWLEDAEREVPVVARVAAGLPLEEVIEGETLTLGSQFARLAGDICILRVKGNSMVNEHLLDGDLLVCRRNAEPQRHAITVVELKGERGATVKRWERHGDDITLTADFNDPESPRQHTKSYYVGKTFQILGLIRRF